MDISVPEINKEAERVTLSRVASPSSSNFEGIVTKKECFTSNRGRDRTSVREALITVTRATRAKFLKPHPLLVKPRPFEAYSSENAS